MDLVSAYAELTRGIVDFTGIPRPMLHLHAGMAIYLAAQMVLGTRRGSFIAVIAVLVAELFNEVMNRLHYGSWRWADTSADICLTLFWPAASYAVSKFRRWRWRMRERKSQAKAAAARILFRLDGPAAVPESPVRGLVV